MWRNILDSFSLLLAGTATVSGRAPRHGSCKFYRLTASYFDDMPTIWFDPIKKPEVRRTSGFLGAANADQIA
jgi:hypothetical protein